VYMPYSGIPGLTPGGDLLLILICGYEISILNNRSIL